MRKRDAVTIAIAWSLLIYVGYNVLTVEASEKEDKKVCEDYNGKWKETVIVDADGNEKGSGEKQCQFDKDKDLKLYSIRPGYSLDGTGPDGEYGREDLGEEEAANIEDEICDNEDADTTNIKMCKSDTKKACDKAGAKMKDGYCDVKTSDGKQADKFYEEQVKEEQKVEDWKNTVEPTENIELKSPTITIPIDKDDSEEEADEKVEKAIAEYNKEADEVETNNDEEEEENDDSSEEKEDDSNDEEDSSESE